MSVDQQPRILVVDDDERARRTLNDILIADHYSVLTCADGATALKLVRENDLDTVLLDLVLPDINGIEVLRQIKKEKPRLPVIIISGYGTIRDAVSAAKAGAYDFLEKSGFDKNRLLLLVRRAIDQEKMAKEIALLKTEIFKKYHMVGVSPPMRKVFEFIENVGPQKANVIITGESGVGKELVARALHFRSPRKDKPFIKINCAAIPKELIESELFGYEKGAFTDAKTQKKGKLELADTGTLFLDEIGDMSLSAQAKLLHFIQDGVFERLGGTKTHKVDVRIVAATNKNLEEEIREYRFREDLFYRLNVVGIYIPPLRSRREDIPVLADYFLEILCEEHGTPKKTLTEDAMEFLKNQYWKGNCRELNNLIERAVIMVKQTKITAEDLIKMQELSQPIITSEPVSLRQARADFEREYMLNILAQHNWNLTEVAQVLKIDRAHLYRKLKRLKIEVR
uniref:Sigma-54-dependent Fis family transcriptional regulator n=1 Tax=candidate division WOR-3 bacterium TaxID=2052148 RepID=A0A7C6A9J4_UNCW3